MTLQNSFRSVNATLFLLGSYRLFYAHLKFIRRIDGNSKNANHVSHFKSFKITTDKSVIMGHETLFLSQIRNQSC